MAEVTTDIITDIDALLSGDLSGPEQVRAVLREARDALAAMGEREPVAWEHFRDESYFYLWCVRPTGEKTFGVGFHVSTEAEAIALVETLAGKASPRPEAVEEAVKAEMAQPTNEKGAG